MSDLLKLIDWYQAEVASAHKHCLYVCGVLAHTPVPYWATAVCHRQLRSSLLSASPQHFIVAAAYGQLRSQDLRQLTTVNKKFSLQLTG